MKPKLKFFDASSIVKNVKCAVHMTGKLGFSGAAIEQLLLSGEKSISIAFNEEDPNDQNLYMIVNDSIKEGAFMLIKSGDYFYASTKALFDSLGVDYRNHRIIYDIVDFTIDGEKMYKLIKREVKNKKNA